MPEQAQKGDTVQVHYTGRLTTGEVFDSSEDGEPLEFEIGAGGVIKGFDEGVEGMSVGDKKQIEIEVENAYGERNERLVQTIPREGLNLDTEPQAGMNLGDATARRQPDSRRHHGGYDRHHHPGRQSPARRAEAHLQGRTRQVIFTHKEFSC